MLKSFTVLLFLIITSSYIFPGCKDIFPQESSVRKVTGLYKRDMIITANGKTFEGMGVVPSAEKYEFHIESRGKLDMFLLSSCNRDWVKEKAWNVKKTVSSGLFGWSRKIKDQTREITFSYTPINEIERGYCPIWLGGFEKKQGRHSWGFIDFKDTMMNLPAKIECNGEVRSAKGVGVCQSRVGKIQAIEFWEEMVVSPDTECSLGKMRGRRFEFELKPNYCTYLFKRIKEPQLEFRLTTFGYDKILVREVD